MLIVSKIRDYYDTAIVYGIDKSIVYKRQQKTHKFDYSKRFRITFYDSKKNYIQPNITIDHAWNKLKYFNSVECSVIGFCGKIYPVYKFNYKNGNIEYCYDVESTTKILQSANLYEKTKGDSFWSSRFYTSDYIDKFFDRKNWNYLLPLFEEFKEPVFLFSYLDRKYKVQIAPILKDYKFAKVKAPTQAFQEIQNYISGVLGTGENNIVTLSDNMKAQKKGYDKWSFRKHKEDSKKPRKK